MLALDDVRRHDFPVGLPTWASHPHTAVAVAVALAVALALALTLPLNLLLP